MGSVNRVFLMGAIGKHGVAVRYTQSGARVAAGKMAWAASRSAEEVCQGLLLALTAQRAQAEAYAQALLDEKQGAAL